MKENSCLSLKQVKNALTLCMVGVLTSCSWEATSKQNLSIRIDGSSTVYPITKTIVEQYRTMATAELDLTLDFSGTGAGFEKFCAGETEINNASRPITQSEIQACEAE